MKHETESRYLSLPPTLDEISDIARSKEVERLLRDGYVVTCGHPNDPAYDKPGMIENIYSYLVDGDRQFAELATQINRETVVQKTLSLLRVRPPKKTRRDRRNRLEEARRELLYGETQTDSWPWHRQRGRATALLTIACAHDLNDKYPTMSGPLGPCVLDYRFKDDVVGVGGMTLQEAMKWTEMTHSGKSPAEAERRVASRIKETAEFIGAPVTPLFQQVVQYCYDSLGIRERAETVGLLVEEQVSSLVESGREIDNIQIMSVGCGTALPMLQIMQKIKEKHGQSPKIILLDQDPLALAAAVTLATNMGLEDSIEVVCERLFSSLGRPVSIRDILNGRKLDIAEDSGLREYLPDSLFARLTREMWVSLEKDGLMIGGNMNTNRPHKEFLHGLMGWFPNVQMRSIHEGFALHEKAGIQKGDTEAHVTASGVYTVYSSRK